MSVDPNTIKAGDYELVALRWDEITSKPGQPFDFVRHYQGDIVTLNVEEARRLVLAGAVIDPKAALVVPGSGPSAPPGEGDDPERTLNLDVDVDVAEPVVDDDLIDEDDDDGYDPGAEGETVEKVIAFVGGDPEVAGQVLELEMAGKNRSGLVAKLEAIVAAATS